MENEITDRKVTLTVNLTVVPEDREDKWTFWVKELGVTIYANSLEDGPATVERGLTFLINGLQKDGFDRLLRYLDARGVGYTLEVEGTPQPEEYVQEDEVDDWVSTRTPMPFTVQKELAGVLTR